MITIICILFFLFCGLVDCSGNEMRWRRIKATGLDASKYPVLALFATVEYPPNHSQNMIKFFGYGLAVGVILQVLS